MKNLNQIKLVKKYLMSSKDKFFGELKKLDNLIARKMASIEKLRLYKSEYDGANTLQLTRVTPLLQKNLSNFIYELSDLIQRDENELYRLNQAKNSLRVKCEKIKNQLDYICDREKKVSGILLDLKEKEAQKSIDELVSNHFIRKAYD